MTWQHIWLSTGIGSIACSLAMLILWVYSTRKRDASIVDVAWASLLCLLAISYAGFLEGLPQRRLLIGLMGGIWGLRLGLHLLVDRVMRAREEDGRYQELRARWGDRANRNFFLFFQAQGLLAALLSIPFAIASNTGRSLGPLDWTGAALWIIGLFGEWLADRQLATWRRKPESKGHTCRTGLWRYSRHPNYFFEWTMWCSFALVATSAPWGWVAWFAPMLMLFLILRVTGVPPTEERALRSRGEDYRKYQKSTSVFIPWFPRT